MARSYQTRQSSSIIESIAAMQRHFRILTSRQCHYYDLPFRYRDRSSPSFASYPLINVINVITPDWSVSRAEARASGKERPRVSAKFCRGEREGGGGEEGDELISRWLIGVVNYRGTRRPLSTRLISRERRRSRRGRSRGSPRDTKLPLAVGVSGARREAFTRGLRRSLARDGGLH